MPECNFDPGTLDQIDFRSITITMKKNLLAVSLLVTINLLSAPRVFSQADAEKIDRFISLFTGVHHFSGVVLVSSGDSVLFNKPYGMANYEWNIPNSTSSVFRIASLSKAFTAAMILQMSDQGKLDLQTPVSKYLPEYTGVYRDSITIHQLLSHSSGIPHYEAIPDFDPRYTRIPVSTTEYIRLISEMKPLFSPGKGYHYSSFGYFLLGAILEKVSGMKYPEILRSNILEPVGMKKTSFDEMTALRPLMTTGYSFDHTGIINCRFEDTYKSTGCGGLISTAGDMFLWSRALKKGLVLSDSSTQKMFSKQSGSYGYGWIIQETTGRSGQKCILATHEGSDFGFASYISLNMNEDLCIIVLSNLETPPVRRIAHGITQILYGKEINPPVVRPMVRLDKNSLGDYSGKYRISSDYFINVYEEKNGLTINWTGLNNRLLLFSSSDSTFYIRENDKLFTFSRNVDGKVTALSFNDSDGKIKARRVE